MAVAVVQYVVCTFACASVCLSGLHNRSFGAARSLAREAGARTPPRLSRIEGATLVRVLDEACAAQLARMLYYCSNRLFVCLSLYVQLVTAYHLFDQLVDRADVLFAVTCAYEGVAMADALAPGRAFPAHLPPPLAIAAGSNPSAGSGVSHQEPPLLSAPSTETLEAVQTATTRPALYQLASLAGLRAHGFILLAPSFPVVPPAADLFRSESRAAKRLGGSSAGEMARFVQALLKRSAPQLAQLLASRMPMATDAAAAAAAPAPDTATIGLMRASLRPSSARAASRQRWRWWRWCDV